MTEAEILVWSKLRAKQMCGHKFRRQYSVGVYSLDFYCPSLKLAIEIDGDTHFQAGARKYDLTRQEFIERLWYPLSAFYESASLRKSRRGFGVHQENSEADGEIRRSFKG